MRTATAATAIGRGQAPCHASALARTLASPPQRGHADVSLREKSRTVRMRMRMRRLVVKARASAEEKIDPTTGLPISDSDVVKKATVEINGTTWSYRYTVGESKKPTVVLLHGALSSSYSYRRVIDLLGRAGYDVVVPDWPGHGDSGVPAAGKFAFKADDYVHGLSAFLYKVIGKEKKFVLATQGFILGQYGMLYALRNADLIEKLVIFNTPLEAKTPLPGILQKVKGSEGGLFGFNNPFAKSDQGPLESVEAANYMQGGSPYFLDRDDAETYQDPFYDQAKRDAAQSMMKNVNYEELLKTLDEGFQRWRVESLVAFGTSDYYVDWETAIEWLDDKRTCMKFYTFADKMGHTVQDDYPERVAELLQNFCEGNDIQKKSSLKRTGDFTE
ncbi:alpha/beta hydrolase [Chloropicon primus]|uniref:Alpha/beta hydrolase n=2 Tax=Chloropicon primus TaxID=1764295 RepID=A0A5B8MVX8_9CHLO|nr:alpha/beta hydrolase [Chloropicon primus]UPR03027.1 alpha/beta hydrolase [Chloropicon primus]|eukprot:QDZ23814.1 alpha/beta hydrolase [Chloropicon primus]